MKFTVISNYLSGKFIRSEHSEPLLHMSLLNCQSDFIAYIFNLYFNSHRSETSGLE